MQVKSMNLRNAAILLFLWICSLQCMDDPRVVIHYIPFQHINSIDDVPAAYIELTLKVFRMRHNETNGEEKSIRCIPHLHDALIMGRLNQFYNHHHYFNRRQIHNQDLMLHPAPHNGGIAACGKAYEKIISSIKIGWIFTSLQMFPDIVVTKPESDWYLFIKDTPSYDDHKEDLLIKALIKRLGIKSNAACASLWKNTDLDHSNLSKIYLWANKNEFEKVQSKLRFHLPSQEELTQQELSHELPFLDE